jgi:phage-related protein (TIGR01555 family)
VERKANWARTSDGFENFAARLGLGQDNTLARSGYAPGQNITRNRAELEEMYRSSWVVARMVEVVAEDMARCGMDIQGSLSTEDVSLLLRTYRVTGIPGRIADAVKWSRLFGGALAVLLIDGQDLESPMDLEGVTPGSFRGLYVLDRHQVAPSTEKIDALGPMLGYPEYYTLNSRETGVFARAHHSRCLRFIGVDLPYYARESEQSWGGSVVERAHDRILALDSATHGAANLLFKSYLRIIGVEGYRQILANGGKAEEALHKMFAFIRRYQSNEGITLLDKNDTFQTTGWTFAGVYDAIQAFCEQIAGATGIPLVRLLGQSPKGFSSGESDLRIYYDTILTQLDDDKRSVDMLLFSVLSRHLWGRPLPEDFGFEYQSLFVPTESEKSQIATADAQAVAGLVNAGVIDTAQALAELRDAGRMTGRFTSITEEDIEAARREALAPPLPEGTLPALPEGVELDISGEAENAETSGVL